MQRCYSPPSRQGASELCGALTGRTAPSLLGLSLTRNPLGDAGAAAVALCLQQLPALQALYLSETGFAARPKAALHAAAYATTHRSSNPPPHWPWGRSSGHEGSPRREDAEERLIMACALLPARSHRSHCLWSLRDRRRGRGFASSL